MPFDANETVCARTKGTTLISTTLFPTVLTIVSTGLSDLSPNFVLLCAVDFVPLVPVVRDPLLETAVFGSGLT